MSVETRCGSCGFTTDNPDRKPGSPIDDHLRLDHRRGLLRFLLGDYFDPGARAEERLHRERIVGYIFPFDERIELLRNDFGETFRVSR